MEKEKIFRIEENEITETDEQGVIWINKTVYRVYSDGTKEVAATVKFAKIPDEPTEEEVYKSEILLNQMQVMAKQEEQDEVLAEILLQGVQNV